MAEAATKRFSLSVETWQMRLQVLIQLKSGDVTQCFEEAVKRVKSKVCAGFIDLHALVLDRKPVIFFFFFFLPFTRHSKSLTIFKVRNKNLAFHMHIAFRSIRELQIPFIFTVLKSEC